MNVDMCFIYVAILFNNVEAILNEPKNAIETNKRTGDFTIYKSYPRDIFGMTDTGQERQEKYLSVDNTTLKTQRNVDKRHKRNAVNLYNMLTCATGCNPLIYKGYGCYCGFLGSGFPVDGIDRCCRTHDWCYINANCPFYYLEYFIPYYWQCFGDKPVCSRDNGIFGGSNSCSFRLCECDRRLANCLKKYTCPSYRAYCETSPWRFAQNILMNF